VWLVVRVSEIVNSHSGYVVPFSPWEIVPFVQGGADRHEFHHSNNVGSYGSFTKFWDWLAGTDEAFNRFVAQGRSKRGLRA
jgi:sterol desaturase/sphingolipid hydroxylase (fatty acid hydroxylase superfamily)